MVQPVPAPPADKVLLTASTTDGGSSQNLKLLRRGSLISLLIRKIGNKQLPNPPIAVGITKKKIIKIA